MVAPPAAACRDFRLYARFDLVAKAMAVAMGCGGVDRGGVAVKRDIFKFLSGLFAGFAVEHAVIAIYLSAGGFDLPQFMGRQWPDWSPWLGAALYGAIGIWLGYLGWRKKEAAHHEA